MASTSRYAPLCASLAFLLSCTGHSTSWVLDLSKLESNSAEPGSTLEFSGHNFPANQSGELVLRGSLHTPGESPKSVSLPLRALAGSSTRLTAFIDDNATRTLKGHATFHGRAQARFKQEHGAVLAGEARNVVFEWAGNEDLNDARLRLDGQRAMESLGLEVAEPTAETGTVRIAGVEAGGVAAGARVVIGDRIVMANGLHVRTLADLAQPSGTSSITFVLRDAIDQDHTVSLDMPRSASALLEGYHYLLWVCPVVLALLLLGPWPAPVELVRAGSRRLQRRRFVVFRAIVRSKLNPTIIIVTWMSICAAISSIGAWPGSGLTLTAALVAYLGLLVFRASRMKPKGASAISDPIERRATVLTYRLWFLGDGLIVAGAVAASAVLGGSSSFAMLASEQGAVPWGWSILARPPVWLAAWLMFSRYGRLHRPLPGHALQVSLDNLGRVILGMAVTVVWFGSGTCPSLGLGPAVDLGVASASFAVKLFGVLCLFAFVQPLAARSRALVWRVGLATASAVAAWSWIAPERTFEVRLGCSMLVSLMLAGTLAALEYVTAKRQRPTLAASGPETRTSVPPPGATPANSI